MAPTGSRRDNERQLFVQKHASWKSMCVAQLNNATAQALCCAGVLNDPAQCALCPNPDLAGIGVRVAFYLQSFVNALLIAFSPSDSVPTAWAGTLLTLALVIAGFVSKQRQNLTLHHATLVLNFVTLSTISSLAVAPMLPIWRLSPAEYYERHRRRHALLFTDVDDPRFLRNMSILEGSIYANTQKRRVKAAQRRQREILSIVLLLQVILQWAWGIYLFVDTKYSQPELNSSTMLVMFMVPFQTGSINNSKDHAGGYLIWAAWILFCLCVTMLLVINLAMSGATHSQTSLSSFATGTGTGMMTGTPVGRQWENLFLELFRLKITKKRAILGLQMLALGFLWTIFIAASEWQRALNCIFEGEEGEQNFGGLGQITAIFVSVAPLWSLAVALYRYPALRRKRQRLRRIATSHSSPHDLQGGQQPARPTDNAQAVDETDHLLRPSISLTPIRQHLLLPSEETLRDSSESFEMGVMAPISGHNYVDDHSSSSSSLPSSYHLPAPPTQELHHHRTSSLKTTATPLAEAMSNTSASSSRLGSDSGVGSASGGMSGSASLNRRPAHRPRGPRDGVQRSPSSPEYLATWSVGRTAGSWLRPSYV